MTRVLLTGASGYVGRALCNALEQAGYCVRAAYRVGSAVPSSAAERFVIEDLGPNTAWDQALAGVDVVYHVAALAHVLRPSALTMQAYMQTNALGTRALADAAVRLDVQRFVYVSTIKVNGEATFGQAYSAADQPNPGDEYAVSKLLGEQYVAQAAAGSRMQFAIVRPPLVYGPGVRANFLRVMQWIQLGVPLPLASIENRRSLVSIWNLCDLLVRLAKQSSAPNRVWMVSDGLDLSTPDLLRRIARAMGRPARLLPVPPALLRLAGRLSGLHGEVARLCDSLAVDIAATRVDLGWNPPLPVDEALARTVGWYMSGGRQGAT